MKTCSRCGEVKELGEFSKKAVSKDGLAYWCKLCMSIVQKKWNEANPEKIKAKGKKWREANPEKIKTSHIKWRKANAEKLNAKSKKWQKANPEKLNAGQKKYREENTEKLKVKNKKYSEELGDGYLKKIIKNQFQIPASEIPPEMIELKRIELENKRLKKELKK